MILSERISKLQEVFNYLEATTSRLDKEGIIAAGICDELKDDFQFCLEILDGRHKLGYTFPEIVSALDIPESYTLRKYLAPAWGPLKQGDLSQDNIIRNVRLCSNFNYFIRPLVNRQFRLGIGKSILPAAGMAPMLAKKYEGDNIPWHKGCEGVIVTQKLDGNRCISWFDGKKWQYQSRNAKPMNVQFDMHLLPTDRVYDGEILSYEQAMQITDIRLALTGVHRTPMKNEFNKTSGLINQKHLNKALVYCIFDILDDRLPYLERRMWLDSLSEELYSVQSNIRILPILAHFKTPAEFDNNIYSMLDIVTGLGGEGLMLNMPEDKYVHKRTDSLLKFKKVQTMDMRVIDVLPGTGVPGPGRDGAIEVAIKTEDGKFISCKVGSGLTKDQCERWAECPEAIIGKTVEIAYHESSQKKSAIGSNNYSLRFPRLKKIRGDKDGTSEY